jgi:hypothetical protein
MGNSIVALFSYKNDVFGVDRRVDGNVMES